MKILVRKKGDALIGAYSKDIEVIAALINNCSYNVDIKQSRIPGQHAKYWALCRLLYNQRAITGVENGFSSEEEVSDYFKEKCGLVEWRKYREADGVIYFRPKSIAWDEMEQIEFGEYYKKMVELVANILGCTVDDIKENLIF